MWIKKQIYFVLMLRLFFSTVLIKCVKTITLWSQYLNCEFHNINDKKNVVLPGFISNACQILTFHQKEHDIETISKLFICLNFKACFSSHQNTQVMMYDGNVSFSLEYESI